MISRKKRASTKKIVKNSKIAKLQTHLSFSVRGGYTYAVVDILKQILSIHPKDFTASALLAIYYDIVDRHKDADSLIYDLLTNLPGHWQPYYAQGMVEIMRGSVKSGKEKLCRAIELASDSDGKELPKSALEWANKELIYPISKIFETDSLDNSLPINHLNSCRASWLQGLPREAIKGIDSFISAHPDLSTGYYFRAIFNNEIKEFSKVEDDITKAIESKLQIARIEKSLLLQLRAASRISQENKLPEAINDITEAIALDPNNSDLLFWRSRTYCRQGDKEKGWLDVKTIIDDRHLWNSKFAEKAAIHCLILRRFEEGNRLIERALIDFPDSPFFAEIQATFKAAGKDTGTEREEKSQFAKKPPHSIASLVSGALKAVREGNAALAEKYLNEIEKTNDANEQTETDKSKSNIISKIPDYVKIYAKAIKEQKRISIDFDELEKATGISASKWKSLFKDTAFLLNLHAHLKKRATSNKFSKTPAAKQFWTSVFTRIDSLLNDVARKKMKETRYRDDRRTKEVYQTVSLDDPDMKKELENDVNKNYGGKKTRREPEE